MPDAGSHSQKTPWGGCPPQGRDRISHLPSAWPNGCLWRCAPLTTNNKTGSVEGQLRTENLTCESTFFRTAGKRPAAYGLEYPRPTLRPCFGEIVHATTGRRTSHLARSTAGLPKLKLPKLFLFRLCRLRLGVHFAVAGLPFDLPGLRLNLTSIFCFSSCITFRSALRWSSLRAVLLMAPTLATRPWIRRMKFEDG